jgi:hypothetical protein
MPSDLVAQAPAPAGQGLFLAPSKNPEILRNL